MGGGFGEDVGEGFGGWGGEGGWWCGAVGVVHGDAFDKVVEGEEAVVDVLCEEKEERREGREGEEEMWKI